MVSEHNGADVEVPIGEVSDDEALEQVGAGVEQCGRWRGLANGEGRRQRLTLHRAGMPRPRPAGSLQVRWWGGGVVAPR